MTDKFRTISLAIRGRSLNVDDVVESLAGSPYKIGRRGDQMKPAVAATYPKNVVIYRIAFDQAESWNSAFDRLVELVGGKDRLSKVIVTNNPEHVEFDIYLPVRRSDEQEDGFMSVEVISYVSSIGGSIGFCFA